MKLSAISLHLILKLLDLQLDLVHMSVYLFNGLLLRGNAGCFIHSDSNPFHFIHLLQFLKGCLQLFLQMRFLLA